jgi:hypothetical protein
MFRSLEHGKFKRVLKRSELKQWDAMVRRAMMTPNQDQVALRIKIHEDDSKYYYIWVAFKLLTATIHGGEMQLDGVYVPDEDEDHWHTTPEELVHTPYLGVE